MNRINFWDLLTWVIGMYQDKSVWNISWRSDNNYYCYSARQDRQQTIDRRVAGKDTIQMQDSYDEQWIYLQSPMKNNCLQNPALWPHGNSPWIPHSASVHKKVTTATPKTSVPNSGSAPWKTHFAPDPSQTQESSANWISATLLNRALLTRLSVAVGDSWWVADVAGSSVRTLPGCNPSETEASGSINEHKHTEKEHKYRPPPRAGRPPRIVSLR